MRLIRFSGLNLAPGPDFGGPSSILQDEGASTAVTGTLVFSIASMTDANGGLTSPEKLKPKIESTTWSVSFKAPWKSSVNGTPRFLSCSDNRCMAMHQSCSELDTPKVLTW